MTTNEKIREIIHGLKYGREIVGSCGESAGVSCPHCGCRQYPQRKAVDRCLDCGQLYRIPENYQSRTSKYNEFITRFLSPEHRTAGLHLAEDDDHTIKMMHGDNLVNVFTSGATIEAILCEADQWLESQKSGVNSIQVN